MVKGSLFEVRFLIAMYSNVIIVFINYEINMKIIILYMARISAKLLIDSYMISAQHLVFLEVAQHHLFACCVVHNVGE